MSQQSFFDRPSPDGHISSRPALGGHGILSDADVEALSAGCRRVWTLMRDHCWHSAKEVRIAAGGGVEASEGLRRLRELRAYVTVERKRGEGRNWLYKVPA